MPREAALIKKVRAHLDAIGGVVEKRHGSMYAACRPDVEWIYCGMVAFVECKRDDGKLTPLQSVTFADLREHCPVWVVRPSTFDEFVELTRCWAACVGGGARERVWAGVELRLTT